MTALDKMTPLSPFIDGFYDARAELVDHVYRRTEGALDAADRALEALDSPDDVRRRQQQTRAWTRRAVGGLIESSGPVAVEFRGSTAQGGYTIEKIVLQSLPGMYVTGNLYVPTGTSAPRPAVLFLCGHSETSKADPDYQRVCGWLARCGFVVLIIDAIGQGERKSYLDPDGNELVPWGIDEHSYAGLQCWWLGTSVARYFINDAQRALDYLASRDDVDPNRIGITGSSGGGTQSALMMMLDDRIAAAAPATFITSRRAYLRAGQAQDAEQILLGGTSAGITHADLLLAMAPRPVHVMAVDYDFFSIEGTVETVDMARHAYRLLGHEDRLTLFRSRDVHRYTAELARSAVEFFTRELSSAQAPELPHFEPLAQADLQCTESGQVQLEYENSRTVFELLTDERTSAANGQAHSVQEPVTDWLHERVHAKRPVPSEFFPRWLPSRPVDSLNTARRVVWRSERQLFNHGVLYERTDHLASSLVIAVWDEGTDAIAHRRDWISRRLEAGESVLVTDLRGTGALAPRPINGYDMGVHYGTAFKFTCDLLELGDSLAAGRVFDLLRALQFVRTDPELDIADRPVRIHASGAGQFFAVLAGALDTDGVNVDLETDLIDPRSLVTERYFDFEYSLATVIPGLLDAGPFDNLLTPLAGRLTVRGEPLRR